MLEALRYKLSFFPVHQLIQFISASVLQKYGISVNAEEIGRKTKMVFCSDFYFLENPIIVCLGCAWDLLKDNLLWENFLKIFGDLDIKELENKVKHFENGLLAILLPSEEQMNFQMKNFEMINKILAKIKQSGKNGSL